MSYKIRLGALAALCATFVVSAAGSQRNVLLPGAGEQPGAVLDLGTLGGESAGSRAINIWGVVTGDSTTPDELRHGFLAIPGQPMRQLRGLADDAEPMSVDINDRGDVVGSAGSNGFILSARVVRDLSGDERPTSINNLRLAVGWRYQRSSTVSQVAVAWGPDGVSRVLDRAGRRGEADDVNDRGEIVGWVQDASGPGHTVIWEPDGRVVELDAGNGRGAIASAINEAGDVAGFRLTADGLSHACLWRRHRRVVDILPADPESLALGLNDVGQVVGVLLEHDRTGDLVQTPFVWSAETGLVRLTKLVGGAGRAVAVNSLGEIVGWVEEPSYEGPGHATWWYEPPTMPMEFWAIRRLLAVLDTDREIGRGHAQGLTADIRAAERAWAAGDGHRSAHHLRSLSGRLARAVRDGRRGIHLAALLDRLALRLEQ